MISKHPGELGLRGLFDPRSLTVVQEFWAPRVWTQGFLTLEATRYEERDGSEGHSPLDESLCWEARLWDEYFRWASLKAPGVEGENRLL